MLFSFKFIFLYFLIYANCRALNSLYKHELFERAEPFLTRPITRQKSRNDCIYIRKLTPGKNLEWQKFDLTRESIILDSESFEAYLVEFIIPEGSCYSFEFQSNTSTRSDEESMNFCHGQHILYFPRRNILIRKMSPSIVESEEGVEFCSGNDDDKLCKKYWFSSSAGYFEGLNGIEIYQIKVPYKFILWIEDSDSKELFGPFNGAFYPVNRPFRKPVFRLIHAKNLFFIFMFNIYQNTNYDASFNWDSLNFSGRRNTAQSFHLGFGEYGKHKEGTVGLATQFSVDRMKRFAKVIKESWYLYPVSACIYLDDSIDKFIALSQVLRNETYSSFGRHPSISIVMIEKAFYEIDDSSKFENSRFWATRYPINLLRNIAILYCRTEFIFMIDIDFKMSSHLDTFINRVIVPEIEVQRIMQPEKLFAFVVPCVGLTSSLNLPVPRTIDALKYLWKSQGRSKTLIYEFEANGHSNTGLQKIIGQSTFFGHNIDQTYYGMLNMDSNPKAWERFENEDTGLWKWNKVGFEFNNPSYFSEVCFEDQWEPYYIIPKFIAMRDDEGLKTKLNTYYWLMWSYFDKYQSSNNLIPRNLMLQLKQMSLGISNVDPGEIKYEMEYLSKLLLYDVRFENQGGDKQSHSLLLHNLGFQFRVLNNHFLIHIDHSSNKAADLNQTKNAQISQKHEPKRMYDFFSEFLPEMEQIFGRFFRWDSLCKNHLLSHHQCFISPFDTSI